MLHCFGLVPDIMHCARNLALTFSFPQVLYSPTVQYEARPLNALSVGAAYALVFHWIQLLAPPPTDFEIRVVLLRSDIQG